MRKSTIVFSLLVLVVLLFVLSTHMDVRIGVPVEMSLEKSRDLNISTLNKSFTVVDEEKTYESEFKNGQYQVIVPNYTGKELRVDVDRRLICTISSTPAGSLQFTSKINPAFIAEIVIVLTIIMILLRLGGKEHTKILVRRTYDE